MLVFAFNKFNSETGKGEGIEFLKENYDESMVEIFSVIPPITNSFLYSSAPFYFSHVWKASSIPSGIRRFN